MADSFDQFETLLREYISDTVVNLQLKDDDPSWNMMDTFEPDTIGGKRVYDTSASEFPAGYEAQYRVKVQSGGRIASGKFAGNTLAMMGKDKHLAMGQAASALYLDPTLTPLAAWIELRLILKRILGSVTVNHQQVTAQLASTPIEDVGSDYLEDATRRFRSHVVNVWYGAGDATLAQVNKSGGYTVLAADGGTEIVLDNGTYGRFMKGDLIVAGSDDADRTQRTGNISGFMRVVNIDTDSRTIYLQAQAGEGDITLSDDDHLILADTFDFAESTVAASSMVGEGVESLLINSGTYPGSTSPAFTSGLDVAHHSELKSFLQDDESAKINPTMDALTELLDKILDTGRDPPTAFISERSVWTLHAQLERENNALYNVPMGGTFQAAGGVAGPVLSHMEHRFQKFSSIRVRPNSVLGINPSTWRRYMPLGDRTIHWVYGTGPLSGIASIFGPVSTGTQLTELADAPFNAYLQFGCTDPRANFRRLGLNAQRDV